MKLIKFIKDNCVFNIHISFHKARIYYSNNYEYSLLY